jgi:hypothetical protein
MQFNQEYIDELIKKRKYGMIIKLMENHINEWSMDDFNYISTKTINIFVMVYYFDSMFMKNTKWKCHNVDDCYNLLDYCTDFLSDYAQTIDVDIRYIKYFSTKLCNIYRLISNYMSWHNYPYIFACIKISPYVRPVQCFSTKYMVDVIVNMNINNGNYIYKRIQPFTNIGFGFNSYQRIFRQYMTDYMICRYPKIYDMLNVFFRRECNGKIVLNGSDYELCVNSKSI